MADVDGRSTGSSARKNVDDAEDLIHKAYGTISETTRAAAEKATSVGREIAEVSLSCLQENVDAAFDAAIQVHKANGPATAFSAWTQAVIAAGQRSASQGRRLVDAFGRAPELARLPELNRQ